MANGQLRAGLIGAGWIAGRHVAALDASPAARLVAVCDTDLDRAAAIADPRGARVHADWRELYEREQLDLVWVCIPPLAHREVTVEALARGIHVYLEKPLSRTLDDGLAIVQAAARADAICAVGYQWHSLDLLSALRELVDGQDVGLLVGRNFGPTLGRPWFMRRSQGGGQIFERASHNIDLQRAIAGEVVEARAVAGSVALAEGSEPQGAEVEADAIEQVGSLLLRFESGAVGAIHTAWTHAGQPHSYGLEVVATDATLTLELGSEPVVLRGRAGGREIRLESAEPALDASVRRFVEAVTSGDRDRVACTPADALATLRVALACEQALSSGAAVAVG